MKKIRIAIHQIIKALKKVIKKDIELFIYFSYHSKLKFEALELR